MGFITKLYCHFPYESFYQFKHLLVKYKANPEIFIKAEILDNKNNFPSPIEFSKFLRENNLKCTIHSPFVELTPGGYDIAFRKLTLKRFKDTIEFVKILNPDLIVFHDGYDFWRKGFGYEKWINNSVETWRKVLKWIENTKIKIAIENVFDPEPQPLKDVVSAVNKDNFKVCLDI